MPSDIGYLHADLRFHPNSVLSLFAKFYWPFPQAPGVIPTELHWLCLISFPFRDGMSVPPYTT